MSSTYEVIAFLLCLNLFLRKVLQYASSLRNGLKHVTFKLRSPIAIFRGKIKNKKKEEVLCIQYFTDVLCVSIISAGSELEHLISFCEFWTES